MNPLIGSSLLNRYTLEAELGKGGMGVVYKAHDTMLDRAVAIKFPNLGGANVQTKERLLQEARSAARLNHPNIVLVFDAGEVDGDPFIVMEFVQGQTLRNRMSQTIAEALKTAGDICKALAHAHARGIIHRDLKPENIILTDSQTLKLMDFGLARSADMARLTDEGAIIGTALYIAPELIEGENASPLSDLYALGVILYELIAGIPPFSGGITEIISQRMYGAVTAPSQHNPSIPAWLDELVLSLLARLPEDRPASAQEVAALLEKRSAAPETTFQFARAIKNRNNLPAQLTSFIGRERELAQIQELLRANRLLTLTGVGGTGKTRLSLELANAALEWFPDGAWFVELAPIANPDLVAQTIFAALQLQESGKSAQESLEEFLKERELLLLLDNCEHLIQACAGLANHLLQRSAKLKIIVTSREPLGIAGETIWSVPSLSMPASGAPLALDALKEYEATRLFLERARAAQPNFELTAENAKSVANICIRLDGIPLALELAAARVRGMSVDQIASRLDNRFRLLTGGSRAALPRQQTLAALVDWSFNLLSEQERRLFQRLSIFAGPFTLEAAEKICSGESIEEFETLDILQRLVDKSLVIAEERQRVTYYRLLETIRQYGRDKLLASEEAQEIADRHARYHLELASRADREIRGPNQVEWLNLLGNVHDNLRAALEWTIESGQTENALQLAGNLAWYWFVRSHHNEGRQWLERVTNLPQAETHLKPYTEALTYLAHHIWLQLHPKQALPVAERAIASARLLKDQGCIARTLTTYSLINIVTGQFEQCLTTLEESKAIFKQIGDQWNYAHTTLCIAAVANEKKDTAQSLALHSEAYELFHALGDRFFQSVCLRFVGDQLTQQGDPAKGQESLKSALRLAQKLDSIAEVSLNLLTMILPAIMLGNFARAIRLGYAGKSLQEWIGMWRGAEDDLWLEGALAPCRAALSESAYNEAAAQGRAMSFEQTVAYALELKP